ncbi:MAG: hypothetical protein IT349_02795 [Candidatus Eisenbacteria bacterium]|nr:hypothetical protein [Candidatus Eisenbacteria bacterium]MCC7141006.1 hypothetical protein [Candidatus Eisenbacteria bacterium]
MARGAGSGTEIEGSEVGAAASVCLIDPHLQPSPERSVDLSVSGGAQQERAVDSPWS